MFFVGEHVILHSLKNMLVLRLLPQRIYFAMSSSEKAENNLISQSNIDQEVNRSNNI